MREEIKAMLLACSLVLLPAAALAAPASQAGPGPKRTVSVDVIGAPEAMGAATTNEALIELFTEALLDDGRFIVVERTALANLQSEQQLGQQNTTKETSAQTGQMLGANFLVRATVTKFEANAGGSSLALGGPSFGGFAPSLGRASQRAVVGISLRMIDTTTGQIVATAKGDGQASSRKTDIGVTDQRTGATLATGTFKATPLGQAAEIAIRSAVAKIPLGAANAAP